MRRMKEGREYFIINIDEQYAPEIYKILKRGQMVKGDWPEGDITFEQWKLIAFQKETFEMPASGVFETVVLGFVERFVKPVFYNVEATLSVEETISDCSAVIKMTGPYGVGWELQVIVKDGFIGLKVDNGFAYLNGEGLYHCLWKQLLKRIVKDR